MLSQYKPTAETRLAASHLSSMESRASPPGGDVATGVRVEGRDARRCPQSTTNRLLFGRLRHQHHQVMRHPAGSMPRYIALLQIVSLDRAHAKRLDCLQIHYDLRSSLQSVLGLHLW